MALNTVSITGTFDDGSTAPLSGQVVFTPSQTVYAAGIPVVSTSNPVIVQVISGVLQTVKLVATDNTGLTFTGLTGFWFWTVQVTLGGVTQAPWSFSLPSSPSTRDLYSLANTPAVGLPLTTLGDTVYENATPALARLPGNTTTTKNFYTQTGTGSVSAAPAWGTIAASDLAATANEQGNAPLVLTPSGVMAWGLPWQFFPEAYGAKGIGKVLGDVVTNGTTTITSASASFTSADVGKTIMINGALGTAAQPLITTIASFTNSTTVVLTAGATASASGCSAIYGSDDTAAINSAVSAASTYAQANSWKAQVIFGARLYCLASGPTQSGDGATTPTFNSQVPLPFPNANGTTQKLVLEFIGAGDAAQCQYFKSTIPNLPATCLVSMVTPPASGGSATFGAQSVLGGPSAGNTTSGAFGFTGGFANVLPVISGICVVVGWGNQGVGFDFRFTAAASVPNAGYQTMAAVLGNAPLLSTIATVIGQNSAGLYMPFALNNDDCFVGQFTAEGCPGSGVAFSEHFAAHKLTCVYTNVGAFVRSRGGTPTHGASILHYNCEATNIALQVATDINTQFPLFIGLMDTEVINTWDIQDTSATRAGRVEWADFERTTLNISGAGNLKIVNNRLGPGKWPGQPGVPGSTTPQQNTAWRDAAVTITTGAGVTVSVIAVDGTATGATLAASSSTTVIVPGGKNITLTYAGGTPTWNWVLM